MQFAVKNLKFNTMLLTEYTANIAKKNWSGLVKPDTGPSAGLVQSLKSSVQKSIIEPLN